MSDVSASGKLTWQHNWREQGSKVRSAEPPSREANQGKTQSAPSIITGVGSTLASICTTTSDNAHSLPYGCGLGPMRVTNTGQPIHRTKQTQHIQEPLLCPKTPAIARTAEFQSKDLACAHLCQGRRVTSIRRLPSPRTWASATFPAPRSPHRLLFAMDHLQHTTEARAYDSHGIATCDGIRSPAPLATTTLADHALRAMATICPEKPWLATTARCEASLSRL